MACVLRIPFLPVQETSPSNAALAALRELWRETLSQLPNFGVALVVVLVSWLVATVASRLICVVLRRFGVRHSLKDLFRQLSYIAVWIIGLLAASVVAFPGVTVGEVMTVLGLGSIAIGFAFKDIFENFFAGVLILWRFPFENGDFIEVGDIAGRVEGTTIRMTEIRRTDGELIVLPNAHLFKNPVNVKTSQELVRTEIECGIAYHEDVDAARDVIDRAVRECPTVAGSREVQVFAKQFGASSVDFEITWWTGSEPVELRRSRDEVVAAVKRALDEASIEIPFPYRTLVVPSPIEITGSLRRSRAPVSRDQSGSSARPDADTASGE